VLHKAIKLGITHIDTSDYYGPYTVNELIREALHPGGLAHRHEGRGPA
jgi:pyridoxine 4-dehydrogenase